MHRLSTMGWNRNRIWLRGLIVAPLLLTACRPCGCDDEQMDAAMVALASQAIGQNVQKGHISFDWSPNPFSDDGFTLEVTYLDPGPPPKSVTQKVSGTYKKALFGDSVTFKVEANRLLQSNVPYTIACQGKKLVLTRPGSPPLSFDCSK